MAFLLSKEADECTQYSVVAVEAWTQLCTGDMSPVDYHVHNNFSRTSIIDNNAQT